jgi:peptidoglycan hydrolase-like protein with peptidoglycan-binding domain
VSSSGNSTAILGVASQAISPVNNLVTTVSSVPSNSSVSSSNKYKFNKALSFGSRGVDVTELQKRLIVEGFLSGTATGYFGTMTVAAVKKYQSHYGISPFGNVGPVTRGQLNK